jgi:tripartite ATP-independent transporter DctM subunit
MITALPIVLTVYLGILFLLLALGMWVGVTTGVIGVVSMGWLVRGSGLKLFIQLAYNLLNSFILTAVPLFILLGEILLYSGIGSRLYTALSGFMSRVPGGLLHVNVWSCAILAAASGSSMATAATMSTVAIPELEKRGYKKPWALGSLVVAGSLGIMIPPSIPLIVYGFLTETSVIRLFTAGIVPGIILAMMFSTLIFIQAMRAPKSIGGIRTKIPFKKAIRDFTGILPAIVLITFVLGSIYAGIATPTESAGIGVVGALLIAVAYREFNWHSLFISVKETVIIMGVVGFIIIGAIAMSYSISHLGMGNKIVGFIGSLQFTPLGVMFLIYAVYIFLGCFIEGLPLLLIVVPIVFPIVTNLGFDPVWFGIAIVVGQEAATITPPIGCNLWVVQGITGESMEMLAKSMLPFFVVLVVFLVILTFFPQIALWLPSVLL